MGAAFLGGDVVAVGENAIAGIAVGPLQGDFGIDSAGLAIAHNDIFSTFEVHDVRVDGDLVGVDVFDVFLDAAFIEEAVSDRLWSTLISEGDTDAFIQEGHLTHVVLDGFVVIDRGLGEDLWVWLEGNGRTVLGGVANSLEAIHRVATILETHEIGAAVFIDGDFHPNGKSVNDGSANAVQTTGDFIAAAFAELTTRVENGEYGLDAGDAGLADDINRNTATIIINGDRIAFVDGNLDVFAITS